MIKNYFITAWRNISRNKVYTAINVLGLSIGVCACLVIYLITSFELSYDAFQPNKDHIYRIVTAIQNPDGTKQHMADAIGAMPLAMRTELSGFEKATVFYNAPLKVTVPDGKNEPKKFDAAEDISPIIVAEPQYFDLFKYKWLAGSANTALKEPFKVVLSESEAKKYFGNAAPNDLMGKDIFYNDSLHVTISGIVEDWNKNTDFGFKDFISMATVQSSFLKNDIDLKGWGFWDSNMQAFVKLRSGVTAAQAEKLLPQFIKRHKTIQGAKITLSLQPLPDIHFNGDYPDTYSRKADLPTLDGLMGIAAFILIIAAINFINLSTAQSIRRAKEVGVRKVLGGSKTNLTIQFLIETFMVTIAAVVIAVTITNPIIASFQPILPKGVVLDLFSLPTILFLILVTVITALLAGFYPAKVLSSYLPAISLKGQGTQKLNRKSYLRKSLIVFQFTISLVFIIGTVVIADQIHFIMNKDLGFNNDAIITIHTAWSSSTDKLTVFTNKLRQIPGVALVSKHNVTPAAMGHPGTYMKYEGNHGEVKIDASFDRCDENYVPLFNLKIIAGRNLLPSDTLKEFLVNETCARALGFSKPQDAIGKIVQVGINDVKRPIVGVVRDFHSKSLHEAIVPFFMGSVRNNERAVSIKLVAQGKQIDNFKSTIDEIAKVSKAVYPNEKFEYRFFDETIAALYDKEQKTAILMDTAMSIAIFISCMGLFGLATFTARQRVKEIGIRKVLGASAIGIATILSVDFLGLVVISILIASPMAYYFMHQWILGFAYKITISWWIFLLSGAAAMLIALLTISFQSIKAALANPVNSLRSE